MPTCRSEHRCLLRMVTSELILGILNLSVLQFFYKILSRNQTKQILGCTYTVLSQGHVKQSNPCGVISLKQPWGVNALLEEIEGLGESKQDDDVDDGEGEHVSSDHAEDHGHKRPGQLDGTGRREKLHKSMEGE